MYILRSTLWLRRGVGAAVIHPSRPNGSCPPFGGWYPGHRTPIVSRFVESDFPSVDTTTVIRARSSLDAA